MKYGVTLPFVDPMTSAGLAQDAEEAGWDGVFYWDGIYFASEGPMYDPWVALSAMALHTQRVRLGPMLTPLARRRPWKLARETVSLDHLSGGRLILPVGLGSTGDGGFAKVGEAMERRVRAEKLDEGLAILSGLWSARPFSYEGTHYRLEEMTFQPPPVQVPRIPVWVVGAWPRPRSMARVLRWDGVLPTKMAADGSAQGMTPDDIRAMREWIMARRPDPTAPFDIVMEGETPGKDPSGAEDVVRPLAEAGVTWWLENVWGAPREENGIEGMRARIRQGPPRIEG